MGPGKLRKVWTGMAYRCYYLSVLCTYFPTLYLVIIGSLGPSDCPPSAGFRMDLLTLVSSMQVAYYENSPIVEVEIR